MTRDVSTQTLGTRLRLFLNASAFDALLVLVAATSLVMTVSYGFESAPDLRGNPLLCAGIALPLLLVLFAGSWSKRAMAPATVVALAYSAGIVAVLTSLSEAAQPVFYRGAINDSAESNFVFALVAVIVPALVYLLSRRRAGALVLLLGAVCACEFVQFLYRDWVADGGVVVSVVAITAVIALFVYQGYRASAYAAERMKRTSFAATSAVSCLVALAGMLAGVAVFCLVISGLGLSTPEIKPFKDYFVRPVVEYSANYTRKPVENPDETSSLLSDTKSTTTQNAEGGAQEQSTDSTEEQSAGDAVGAGVQETFDADSWSEALQTINYTQLLLGALLVAVPLALLVVVAVLLWRRRRRRRLERIADEPCAYRIWYLYGFLVERFRRVGFKRPETFTPLEFAMANRAGMLPYSEGLEADFLDVTLAYQRACYDEGRATEEDCRLVEDYYWAFYRNAPKQCGKLKWALWRFWRL